VRAQLDPKTFPSSPAQNLQTAVDAPPVKVFDRTPNLTGAQIISYRVSGDGKWCVLIGITPGLPERCAVPPRQWGKRSELGATRQSQQLVH
jgi:hypothetical protein